MTVSLTSSVIVVDCWRPFEGSFQSALRIIADELKALMYSWETYESDNLLQIDDKLIQECVLINKPKIHKMSHGVKVNHKNNYLSLTFLL